MFSQLLRSLSWLTTSLAIVATAFAANTYRNTPADAAPVAPPPHTVAAQEENPKVKPGLVNWHVSFADAQTASQKSGKPVLLLHMMGQLDRQFC